MSKDILRYCRAWNSGTCSGLAVTGFGWFWIRELSILVSGTRLRPYLQPLPCCALLVSWWVGTCCPLGNKKVEHTHLSHRHALFNTFWPASLLFEGTQCWQVFDGDLFLKSCFMLYLFVRWCEMYCAAVTGSPSDGDWWRKAAHSRMLRSLWTFRSTWPCRKALALKLDLFWYTELSSCFWSL